MDRFVRREPRISDYPQLQGNQTVTFGGGNDNNYYETPFSGVQNVQGLPNPNYGPARHVNVSGFTPNHHPGQGQMVSGIDPRYLAAYADPSAEFIATGQQMHRERCTKPTYSTFMGDYQNRSAERNIVKTFSPNVVQENFIGAPVHNNFASDAIQNKGYTRQQQTFQNTPSKVVQETPRELQNMNLSNDFQTNKGSTNFQQVQHTSPKVTIKTTENTENEMPNQILTRSDKLKALYKSGTRVFSGPVEKILKWHKVMQDIGVLVLYEIVAKCVNVRPGESCAKNLVVRDESGPAMQVVYYEVDFLLPELKPPCTVRVIGKMMAGSSRFQAFNVRAATGDDVAILPRRAAVAAHHVAKLCKEFGPAV